MHDKVLCLSFGVGNSAWWVCSTVKLVGSGTYLLMMRWVFSSLEGNMDGQDLGGGSVTN